MAKFKSLNIGDTVRVVSLADTDARCGLCDTVTASVGSTLIITALKRRAGGSIVQLSNTWWYSPKGLEVLKTTEPTLTVASTGDEHGEFVTPETPVGTTVVYIGGDDVSAAPIGVPLELARHDGDSRPLVEVIGSGYMLDYYYPDYKYLRVHTGHTVPSTPEVAKELTTDDFKYTRVRVKGTGAEGVVVGRGSVSGGVAVLHDETSGRYHSGNSCAKDFVGVPDRIWYYPASDLEIIGGVQ